MEEAVASSSAWCRKKVTASSEDPGAVAVQDEISKENLAVKVAGQYQLVKTIMEYLNVKDLIQATLVNKLWLEIGRIVRKQRRNQPYTILFHPYLPHTALAFEYFNGGTGDSKISEEAKQLVESSSGRYPSYNPRIDRCFTLRDYPRFLSDARFEVQKGVMNAYDESQLIISFGTSAFRHLLQQAANRTNKERMKLIYGTLQESIPFLTSFSCGLVAALPDGCNKSLELEEDGLACLNSIGIPKVDGLRIRLFSVTKSQNRFLDVNSLEQSKSLLNIENETESNLKGILLLHKTYSRTAPVVESIKTYLSHNPKVALAGGVHNSTLISGTVDSSMISAGVLIYGDENVRVSSLALNDTDHIGTDNCRQKLEELKPTLFPDGNSFAFMFACNGRGKHMHGSSNVESNVFNSMFPKTPLLGTFTYGEFCHEFIDTGDPQTEVSPPEELNYAYTTVILLVSYKSRPAAQESGATRNTID